MEARVKPQLVPSTPEPPELNALLEALREAMVPVEGGDPGFTSTDLQDRLGYSKSRVGELLRRLHKSGRLVVGTQYRLAIHGKRMPFTVYRVLP